MIIENVRMSYVNLVKPRADLSGNLRYSAQICIPKSAEATVNKVKEAIQNAVTQGVSRGKFTMAQTKSPSLKRPLRDGDEQESNNASKNHWYMNASNSNPPGLVNARLEPIMSEDEVYSGMYGHVDVQFFPYNTSGSFGIGVSIQNFMKTNDGERLDGRQDPTTAFAEYASSTVLD